VVGQGRQSVDDRGLLATAWGASGNKDAGVFAPVSSRSPLFSGGVPEGLPLSREVPITSWDTEEESIVFLEGCRISDWDVGFGRGVHLREGD